MIELYIVSFVAGILTVLAPCILPILPIIIGGSSLNDNHEKTVSLKHPTIIIASLITSILLFTLLLKASTAFLGVPSTVWTAISGGIVTLFGLTLLFPIAWERLMLLSRLNILANRFMGQTQGKTGTKKDIILGAALGPVFNSCSPTYALIVAVILPSSFVTGIGYLIAYTIGLGAVLFLISIFGRVIVNKMKWMANPDGIFQKVIGSIFVIVGVSVVLGFDKQAQTYILEHGWYDPIIRIEESFRSR